MQANTPIHNKATVLGGGSFGTVLAQVLAENGIAVRMWMRNAEAADAIQKTGHNPKYITTLKLDSSIQTGTSLKWALEPGGLVILAVPSRASTSLLEQCRGLIDERHSLLATAKGIPGPGFTLMHELLEKFLLQSDLPMQSYGLLSGPNIANEIAERKIAATVIASRDPTLVTMTTSMLTRPYFRVFHNPDVTGVEIGGVLKNIYAILAGLADAHDMGQNTKSSLIVRAIAEISRFAVHQGANPLTFLGLAGVGDLIVTCASPHSRNYQAGWHLGKGVEPSQLAEKLHGVAEGLPTLQLVYQKAQQMGISMPLMEGLYAIIFEQQNYVRIIRGLMETMRGADCAFLAS